LQTDLDESSRSPAAAFSKKKEPNPSFRRVSMSVERFLSEEDARFGPVKAKTEAHWRTHNKKYVRLLESNGELERRLNETAAHEIFILNQAEEKGLAPDQARELAYDCLLLPED
jgi:hypothetical protein